MSVQMRDRTPRWVAYNGRAVRDGVATHWKQEPTLASVIVKVSSFSCMEATVPRQGPPSRSCVTRQRQTVSVPRFQLPSLPCTSPTTADIFTTAVSSAALDACCGAGSVPGASACDARRRQYLQPQGGLARITGPQDEDGAPPPHAASHRQQRCMKG